MSTPLPFIARAPPLALNNNRNQRFASNVQPSALFVELEDAAASAAAAAAAAAGGGGVSGAEGGGGRGTVGGGGDERARSAAVGGFWFGLDTRHVEDAPGLAVIKRHPGGLEPTTSRPLQAQLQVRWRRPAERSHKTHAVDIGCLCVEDW